MLPNYIHLPLPSAQTYYCVPAANTLCYLSFFFDAHLSWSYHVDVMCNRACASIKALKLLSNLVKGLDHMSWRLAFNTICLLVLTYSCQLWFCGKQVTLVKKLQIVQNEAIKIISGTFCTTPCKPLHQLLSILPMDLWLTKLTQNTALRLSWVLSESPHLTQWGLVHTTPTSFPSPYPKPHQGQHHTPITHLKSHTEGPVHRPLSEPSPWLPNLAGKVKWIPRQLDWDYPWASEALINLCKEGQVITVFNKGIISNNLCKDGKQLGAASAVLYQNGHGW